MTVTEPDTESMRIDVHAHYFPKDYVQKMIALGRTDVHPGSGQPADFGSRLAAMDEAAVEAQVLSAVGLDCQMHEREAAVQAARFINDAYRDVVDEHAGRFRAFGWLPLPYVEDAVAEAERCLGELDFAGIAMSCFFQGRPLDDPAFEELWAELNRRQTVVYVHPVGMHSCGHPGMSQYGLHTAFGSFMQLSVAATRLVYSGVTQRYPDISFIFAVCGGMLPYMLPRMERNLRRGLNDEAVVASGAQFFAWVKKLPIDAADPIAEFRRFYYDTSVQDVPLALLAARETYGVDRLVLGSDEIFASLTEAVQMIQDSPYLTAEEKTAVLDLNAQRVLKLTAAKVR
jgi:predicted TIM-barrel fold metal-dependent hydrolase